MGDLISRQAAIDVVHEVLFDFFDIDEDFETPMTYKEEQLLSINKAITTKIKALPSASEWISVKDRLPEGYKDVLVCFITASGYHVEVTFYCDHHPDYGNRWYLPVNITHWMPLPEPPEED